MLIHLIPATGLVLTVLLIAGFAVISLASIRPSAPTPTQQQCIEQGIEPDLSSKCERPFS